MRLSISWGGPFGILCSLTLSQQSALAQAQNPPCSVSPILSTHTLAPYPVASVQQDEQGTVMLTVYIGADGAPTDIKIETSSGFPRLDEAASIYVKSHWRWNPPDKGCSNTRVSYNWSLDSLSRAPAYDAEAVTRFLEDHK